MKIYIDKAIESFINSGKKEIKAGVIYSKYRLYCKKQNVEPLGIKEFGVYISKHIDKKRKKDGVYYVPRETKNISISLDIDKVDWL